MTLDHILRKSRDAAGGGFGVLSSGEKVVVALVLNRFDWLAELGYTLAEAIDRAGDDVALIPHAARMLADEQARGDEAGRVVRQALALVAARESPDRDELDCTSTLISYSSSPGYRDPCLIFDLQPLRSTLILRVCMRLRPEDAEPIVSHLRDVHALAWRHDRPLDARPGEVKPRWIGGFE